MTRIVVLYDAGAAEPAEIHKGLSPLGETVFAVPPSEHNRRLLPLLEQIGPVAPIEPGAAVAEVRALRPNAVLTFSESRVGLTAAVAEGLGLPGHSAATARLLTDKDAQRARLRAAGVDATRTAVVRDPAGWERALDEVGVPAVLKPRIGEGSRDTHLVTDAAAGARLVGATAAGNGPYVLEEYLAGRTGAPHGDYVSVETAVSHGRMTHLAVTGKHSLLPPFRERGQFWPARLASGEAESVRRLAGAAVAALGVRTGVTHTEIKLTAAGPRIIEVNGRLGGFLNELSVRSQGVDLVALAGRLALGERVEARPARPDAVYFQHYGPSPTRAHRLLRVTGTADARAVEGVTGYRRLMTPRAANPESVTTRRVDHLWGHAPDHDAMVRVIAEALGRLTYVYEMDGEVVEVPAGAEWGPEG